MIDLKIFIIWIIQKYSDISEGHVVIKLFQQGISEMVNGNGAFSPSLASVV